MMPLVNRSTRINFSRGWKCLLQLIILRAKFGEYYPRRGDPAFCKEGKQQTVRKRSINPTELNMAGALS
jgi:hypothetical protein